MMKKTLSTKELTEIILVLQEDIVFLKKQQSQNALLIQSQAEEINYLKQQKSHRPVQVMQRKVSQNSPHPESQDIHPQVPSTSQETPVQQPPQWKEVINKKKTSRNSYKDAIISQEVQKKPLSFFQKLQSQSDSDKINHLLRRPKSTEEQNQEISRVVVSLPLSTKARQKPLTAWKEAVKALTGHSPLAISLLNPEKAELYFKAEMIPVIRQSRLSAYLLEDIVVQEKDILRRKQLYLKGYFLPLRRAALQGFSSDQQKQLLDLAEKDLPKLDSSFRQQWKFQINKDRTWLQTVSV